MNENSDNVSLIRTHLQEQSTEHLVDLLIDLVQAHIDNGRKTYATAAYYCALLSEIAAYDGRINEFKQYYQDLLNRYPRHRALRRELAAKVDGA